jgi:hypothetical protein
VTSVLVCSPPFVGRCGEAFEQFALWNTGADGPVGGASTAACTSSIHTSTVTEIGRRRTPGGLLVGVDIRLIDDEGAEFVGRYLAKATCGAAMKIGAESQVGRSQSQVRLRV